jgi:hemerythrin-like metal-binding protein
LPRLAFREREREFFPCFLGHPSLIASTATSRGCIAGMDVLPWTSHPQEDAMPLVTWTEELSTNVGQCDEQHKKLIEMINTLHDAMKVGKGQGVLKKVLNELVDYTKTHFRTEEDLFKDHGYPAYLEHKAEHDALTKQVAALAEKVRKGEAVITLEVMAFLKDWLEEHIVGSDKLYGPFLNSKGVH